MRIPSRAPREVSHLRLGQPQLHPASHVRQVSLLLPSRNRQMAQETMKTGKKEPRSIKDILLDIAKDPNDDYGKTLRRLPFLHIHPGREAAIGGKVFGQGLKFLDLVEQGGNRLWQVVKRDSLFCRIHCFLVLSETMASYFVTTEKETRSPL